MQWRSVVVRESRGFYPPKVMDEDPMFEKSPKVKEYSLKSKKKSPPSIFECNLHPLACT